uniref:Uncharacterized protein n=1 Tax=Leersia perrieri TaxID=77586 RepID=A0A0D9VUQ2_9ORYZ
MTPKTVRLPRKGEMLLSVHGSPLGVYNEEKLAAVHGLSILDISFSILVFLISGLSVLALGRLCNLLVAPFGVPFSLLVPWLLRELASPLSGAVDVFPCA